MLYLCGGSPIISSGAILFWVLVQFGSIMYKSIGKSNVLFHSAFGSQNVDFEHKNWENWVMLNEKFHSNSPKKTVDFGLLY